METQTQQDGNEPAPNGREIVRYRPPTEWIRYDIAAVARELIEARAAVQSLAAIPFQRAWADELQQIELKREVAGTSRIEGADFTERELDEAIAADAPAPQFTRSQRQASAATHTYLW
ncbi:MAG: hypothetical protein QGG58_11495, partial [Chloroflexota bacterium]|nr:hypothetical protein [Chloroflexota bacterium]